MAIVRSTCQACNAAQGQRRTMQYSFQLATAYPDPVEEGRKIAAARRERTLASSVLVITRWDGKAVRPVRQGTPGTRTVG